jgi:hypothetical protein
VNPGGPLTNGSAFKLFSASGSVPRFVGVALVGTDLLMRGSNGPALGTYRVLASANVASPVSTWVPIATNSFDANGNFAFTNSAKASIAKQFYLLSAP